MTYKMVNECRTPLNKMKSYSNQALLRIPRLSGALENGVAYVLTMPGACLRQKNYETVEVPLRSCRNLLCFRLVVMANEEYSEANDSSV